MQELRVWYHAYTITVEMVLEQNVEIPANAQLLYKLQQLLQEKYMDHPINMQ